MVAPNPRTVSLPPDLAQFVAERVGHGGYASADEVIADGIRALREQEEWLAETRRNVQEGLEAARRGDLLDGPAVMQQLREKILEGGYRRTSAP